VYTEKYQERFQGRRLELKKAMAAIRAYEYEISRAMISTLKGIPGVRMYGLDDVREIEKRVPTFAFTMEGYSPRQIAEILAEENIYVWDGNYYALAVTERLGVEKHGGMVRVGPVHYNRVDEIERLGEVLSSLG
jgi:selenocysteine lyase/cysteine desulfurase